MEKKEQENQIVKSLIKSIFEEAPKMNEKERQEKVVKEVSKYSQFGKETIKEIPDNLHDMNSLAKSFYVAEGLNTNSFDIRYY